MTATAGAGTNVVTFGIGPQVTRVGQERPFFSYGVTPGAGASDGAEVLNYSLTPIAVSVYTSDVDVADSRDGSASFPSASTRVTDVGKWMSLQIPGNTNTVTVPAREGVVIPFRISVPSNAQPGDHEGGIIASLASFARNAQGDLVRLDQRVAVRAFFRVSGTLRPDITIEDLKASYRQNLSPLGKGDVTVSYTVHNRGNVKLALAQAVDFTGLFGTRLTAHGLPAIPDLLPGGLDVVTVHLGKAFPELLGTVHVTLTPSALPGDDDPLLHPTAASAHILMLPLVLLAILVLLVGLMLYRRRRRPGSNPDKPGGPGATVVADDVGANTGAESATAGTPLNASANANATDAGGP